MKGLLAQNSLIKQVEAQIESRLKAGVRESYMKIVIAGMKYAMKDGPNSIIAQLKGSQDPVSDVVNGAIGVIGLLRRSAKGVMPIDALIPAAMVLVLHGLDYAERMGMLKIDKSVIDQATKMFLETMMPRLGLTPDKLSQVTSRVGGVMADPEKAAMLSRAQQGVQ